MASVHQVVSATLRAARSAALARESRVRFSASAGALVLSASLTLVPHAHAANSDASSNPPAAATDEPLQEITVTGSRIKRTTDFTTATPTTVIDTTTMENAGIVNVGDALSMSPSNISNFTPSTTGNSAFNTGAYVPDLRGLNPYFGSRTLTLVDGQRAVSTNTLDSFDLNFIPQVLVQRIDTVTGGGSALYGSGAVAGVVNVILDHQLEGGKFDADMYDTHYNDAKTKHAAAAYGFGIADNRVHIVVGAEYQKQDPASCQNSGRSWCSANYGPYYTGGSFGPAFAWIPSYSTASRLTTNTSYAGVLGGYSPVSFGIGGPAYTTDSIGVGNTPFNLNASSNAFLGSYYGASAGGDGEPANEHTNLMTGVTRGIITGLVTARITDSITANLDLNWGKVEAYNPNDNFGVESGTLGSDNYYADKVMGLAPGTDYLSAGYTAGYYSKDFSNLINFSQTNDTTLKQAALSFDGKIGQTSWTWEARGLYGETNNVESGQEFGTLRRSMALDAIADANGLAVSRVSQGLASAVAATYGVYGGQGAYGAINSALPTYAKAYNYIDPTSPYYSAYTATALNPVSGMTLGQTLNYFASQYQAGGACAGVTLNPFGTQALSQQSVDCASSLLSLTLQQSMTAFSFNTSGDFWKGIGAGAWSLATGYEWHQEVTHNDFTQCAGAHNTLGNANLTETQKECLATATDLDYQYGNDYGGSSTMNEVYAELSLPLLKDAPFARILALDVAGRESFYTNKALYGVDIVPGTEGTGSLFTYKASLVWSPVDSLRLRGSYSHDSRAPDPRDLYYSQSFVPGSVFGSCNNYYSSGTAQPCTLNLLGNVNLRPETSDNGTIGVVFTPDFLPGFQASADWFAVRIDDGIEGGSYTTDRALCFAGNNSYCSGITFSGATDAASQAAALAAWRNGANNIVSENALAYNGGTFTERGMDLSLSYAMLLPGNFGSLTARALTTWVGEERESDVPGAPSQDLLGQTGYTGFLSNFQSAARWRGNMSVTWTKGNFNLTPNVSWVGQGTISNQAIHCSASDFSTTDTGTMCNWAYNSYFNGSANQTAAQKAAFTYNTLYALTYLPSNVANHVPAYFIFGLNASYTLDKIPGIKNLTLWGQVNNLLNKAPPYTNSTTTNPVFYDQLGQAYRVGFRMTF